MTALIFFIAALGISATRAGWIAFADGAIWPGIGYGVAAFFLLGWAWNLRTDENAKDAAKAVAGK